MPTTTRLLHLLYHRLNVVDDSYGYGLTVDRFREHLRVCNSSSAHSGIQPRITFDDGHVSNHEIAVPELASAGLHATFFITASWVGNRPDTVDWIQLRFIRDAGHTIGAHGWDHTLLTHCDEAELDRQLRSSKHLLEDKLGCEIDSLSFPGGRFNRKVLEACRAAGYRTLYTSVPRVESEPCPELVGRVNVLRGWTGAYVESLLTNGGAKVKQMERVSRAKELAQTFLGDALYGRLWSIWNREGASSSQRQELRP